MAHALEAELSPHKLEMLHLHNFILEASFLRSPVTNTRKRLQQMKQF
jgi:hypothetical protein